VIDILFLAHHRLKFSRASFKALLANTNWGLVDRQITYQDSEFPNVSLEFQSPFRTAGEIHGGVWGSPVAIMAEYLSQPGAEFFAKIDNDVIVPPGWLDQCAATFEAHPELDLLGIEPPDSRCPHFSMAYRPEPTRDLEMRPGPPSYVEVATIGGIGVFRRRAFEGRPLSPEGKYGGFEAWQRAHPEVTRAQIQPALSLFLLDRLPMEPWASLSAEYIAKGWQRPWRTYSAGVSHLWEWWEKGRLSKSAKPSDIAVAVEPDSSGEGGLSDPRA